MSADLHEFTWRMSAFARVSKSIMRFFQIGWSSANQSASARLPTELRTGIFSGIADLTGSEHYENKIS